MPVAITPGHRQRRGGALAGVQFRLHRLEVTIIDDAEVRDRHFDPLAGVSKLVAPFALLRVRIAAPVSTLPDKPSRVEGVVEDADQLLWVAPDGRGIPQPATRSWNTLIIQAGGDLDARQAASEPLVNLANHVCLCLVDREQPTDEFAFRIELDDTLVAISAAPGETPCQDRRFHAAQSLVDKVFEEDRAHQACNGELDLVDLAFADRMQLDAVIGQLLAQPGHVLRVTRQPVE
ncbi:hypothetical protein NZL82_19420 [Sphingomonas sanguinis]|nr:hypothetical protein [Sphingomonas sp. LC-1]MCT8004038.1 hypothetical protein [Sphingomonas sp. LC-1]